MSEQVAVYIKGAVPDDDIEVVSYGKMYSHRDAIVIEYTESVMDNEPDQDSDPVQSKIRLMENQMEIIKTGSLSTHMVFVEGEETLTYYATTFGKLEITIYTEKFEKKDVENGFDIMLNYDLAVNGKVMSKCDVLIEIRKWGSDAESEI